MKAKEFIIELKKESKPRNFVAKNASLAGKAGQHKDKKKAEKQGDVKHKNKQMDMAEAFSQAAADRNKIKYQKAGRIGHGVGWKEYGDDYSSLVRDIVNKFDNITRLVQYDQAPESTKYKIIERFFKKYGYPFELFNDVITAIEKRAAGETNRYSEQSVAERVRDPEDWDEGNTEPPNNFAVYINGKKWKVFKGRGRYADDKREQAHYQQLKDWAAKKSASTGKQWTVSITGETATESVEETSKIPFAGAKVGHKEGPAGQWRNDGSKKNKPAKPGDLVGDGM
jgi:hypothetical protein